MASAFEDIRIKYYQDGWEEEDCFFYAFQNFIKNWGDFETPEKEYKDFVNCWSTILAYFQEYPLATDYFQPHIKKDGAPAVEFKFAIPMNVLHPQTQDPLLFSGRLDMLASPTNDSTICYAMDEKTTKAMGASWQYQWLMHGQFYGYTFAARRMGFDCVGALVRGIAIQQTQFQFQEKPLWFTDEQLDIWWMEANKKAQRMVDMFTQAQTLIEQPVMFQEDQARQVHACFDKSFGEACNSYGGCIFTDLCTSPQPWELYKAYEERIWDPLAKDPAEKSEDRRSQLEEVSWEEFMGAS